MGLLRKIFDTFAGYSWTEKDDKLDREATLAKMRKEYEKREGEKLDPNSWTDDLKLFGFPDSYEERARMARAYGIDDYAGLAEQNEELHALFLDDMLGGGGVPRPKKTAHAAAVHEETQRRNAPR